jgi:peptide-methionine (S)-S-oxide reductase
LSVRDVARRSINLMMERATFGAGCFWGVEAEFRKVEGVAEAVVGYSGGHTKDPSYGDVCSGATGHAEVVEVEYVGTQYRSAIFYHTPEQEAAARASKERVQERFEKPVVTEITPVSEFYRAEEYHQRYFEKNRLARFFSF